MSDRKQAFLLFLLLFFCYSVIHQQMGWNQNSRLDLLHALFVHKTFKIDTYHDNTGNKSLRDGSYYSDKAPGVVFLAVPAFALSKSILYALNIPLDSGKGWLASSWITTAGSVGLITAIGGAAMFLFLCRFAAQRFALIATMIIFLGAAPFPYSTMLFSHAAALGLLCIALWAVADASFVSQLGITPNPPFEIENSVASHWISRHILAGLCCGLALASEYTTAIAAGGIMAFATTLRRAFVLSAAAVPPLLLIPLYNYICFGSPLQFAYHNLALPEFQEMNNGFFGISFPPKLDAIYLILLSPERGLLFWTPFFLMAIPGFIRLARISKKLSAVAIIVIFFHVVCIGGYFMPSGGATLGPRHLSAIIPFIALPAVLGLERYFKMGSILGYASLLLTGLTTIIDATPPVGIRNPVFDFVLPKLANGQFTHCWPVEIFNLNPYLVFSLVSLLIICSYLKAVLTNVPTASPSV